MTLYSNKSLVIDHLFKVERISRSLLNGLALLLASKYFASSSASDLLFLVLSYSVLTTASTLGIDGVVKRDHEARSDAMLQIVVSKLWLTLLFFALFKLFLLYIGKDIDIFFLIIPLLLQCIEPFEWKKIALSEFGDVLLYRAISTTSAFITKLVAITYLSIELFVFSYILEWSIIVSAYFYKERVFNIYKVILDPYLSLEIIWYCITIILVLVFNKLDQFLVQKFLGSADFAVYALASQIIQVPLLLLSNLYIRENNALLRCEPQSYSFYKKYKNYIKKTMGAGLALAIITVLLSGFSIDLFNEKYSNLDVVLKILSLNIIVIAFSMLHAPYWLNLRRSGVVFKLTFLNIIISISAFTLLQSYLTLISYSILAVLLLLVGNTLVPLVFVDGRKMVFYITRVLRNPI